MTARALRAGVTGGMAGGAVMAMWSMVVLWLNGTGFWTPLNLIANTIWRSAPTGAMFSGGALAIGMVMHMMTAAVLGVIIAVAGQRLRLGRATFVATGLAFGAAVWAVVQYGIWHAVDPRDREEFTPWVFAVGHVMFGAVAAAVMTALAPAPAAPHPAVPSGVRA